MDLLRSPHPTHRSTLDWGLSPMCFLDPTHVISPPNALSNQHGTECWAVLTHPDAFNIVYGRIILALYAVPATPTWYPRDDIAVRCQAFPSYPLSPRFYYIEIWHDAVWPLASPKTKLYRSVNLLPTLLAEWPFNPPLNAWTTYRITWIPDCTQPDPKPLAISLEYSSAGDWLLIGSYSDPVNLGHDKASNQIGLSLYDDQHWTDDFYLYQLQT